MPVSSSMKQQSNSSSRRDRGINIQKSRLDDVQAAVLIEPVLPRVGLFLQSMENAV
jgi:hypothetical protein